LIAVLALVAAASVASRSADEIIVDKTARTLTLLRHGQPLLQVNDIKLGKHPIGPKQFEGDGKTPEGAYSIDLRNSQSHFHVSLRISYPNAVDSAAASRAGRPPGGNVFIHGQPNWMPFGTLPYDWTDGCIAVSDSDMDRIWKLAGPGAKIVIRP